MGRSKPSQPKRRRIEDEIAEQDAVEILRRTPQDQIEKAAADATRADLVHWPHLSGTVRSVVPSMDDTIGDSNATHGNGTIDPPILRGVTRIPPWLRGLGVACTLPSKDFSSLQTLHQLIKERAPQWASWSGVEQDPRKRAFGFLPGTMGYNPACRVALDISMPWRELMQPMGCAEKAGSGGSGEGTTSAVSDTDEIERRRNERAIVVLNEIPDGIQEAIDNVCRLFRETLREWSSSSSSSSSVRGPGAGDGLDDTDIGYYQQLEQFLHYSNLIAAQPNLHNGRELLPSHLDHPLKDGFGVVIVTIAMRGSGTILLHDVTGSQRMAMRLDEGGAYMLAGHSRDACIHGVLADSDAADRESLNLRFGLHDYDANMQSRQSLHDVANDKTRSIHNDETGPIHNDSAFSGTMNSLSTASLPVIASSQVLKYWRDSSTDD